MVIITPRDEYIEIIELQLVKKLPGINPMGVSDPRVDS